MKMYLRDTILFILAMAVGVEFFVVAVSCSSAILLSTALPGEFQYLTTLVF
jgi:hypothetical protein